MEGAKLTWVTARKRMTSVVLTAKPKKSRLVHDACARSNSSGGGGGGGGSGSSNVRSATQRWNNTPGAKNNCTVSAFHTPYCAMKLGCASSQAWCRRSEGTAVSVDALVGTQQKAPTTQPMLCSIPRKSQMQHMSCCARTASEMAQISQPQSM